MNRRNLAADQPNDRVPADSSKGRRSFAIGYAAIAAIIVVGAFCTWFWWTWTVWWFDAEEARQRQSRFATKLGIPVEKNVEFGDGVRLEMVLIPSGRFKAGSPSDEERRSPNERQHWAVITRPFYIGKGEVTQEAWAKVMGATPSRFAGKKHPVDNVSWFDCQEFVKKLNALWKERGQFRLPTEVEWEWACRAGSKTRFFYGDSDRVLVDYAWVDGDGSHPVGGKKPNAWGLHDMCGNVYEWCGDWYEDGYGIGARRHDPAGPMSGESRVLRGGSWSDGFGDQCRTASRTHDHPESRMDRYGLRVCLVGAQGTVAKPEAGMRAKDDEAEGQKRGERGRR